MKFSTTILFATAASASFLEGLVNSIYKRDTINVSRNPAPGESSLQVILDGLQVIRTLTVNSTNTIAQFDGKSLTEALAIQSATQVLEDATYNATLAAAQVANLTVADSEQLGAYTQDLAYAVNASIATLISKKPDFEKLNIASLVVTSLQGLFAGSYAFSLTVLQKVPPELQVVSAALSSQIGESIYEGIRCFNGTASSCITTIANPNQTLDQAIAFGTINGAGSLHASGMAALVIAIFAAVLAF